MKAKKTPNRRTVKALKRVMRRRGSALAEDRTLVDNYNRAAPFLAVRCKTCRFTRKMPGASRESVALSRRRTKGNCTPGELSVWKTIFELDFVVSFLTGLNGPCSGSPVFQTTVMLCSSTATFVKQIWFLSQSNGSWPRFEKIPLCISFFLISSSRSFTAWQVTPQHEVVRRTQCHTPRLPKVTGKSPPLQSRSGKRSCRHRVYPTFWRTKAIRLWIAACKIFCLRYKSWKVETE